MPLQCNETGNCQKVHPGIFGGQISIEDIAKKNKEKKCKKEKKEKKDKKEKKSKKDKDKKKKDKKEQKRKKADTDSSDGSEEEQPAVSAQPLEGMVNKVAAGEKDGAKSAIMNIEAVGKDKEQTSAQAKRANTMVN